MGNVSLGLIYKSRYHYSWIDDDTIATGATTNTAGYSANSITNGGFAPAPTVINHPDSVIEPLTYAAGAVTTAPTVGDRVYGTSGPVALVSRILQRDLSLFNKHYGARSASKKTLFL